jgi:hypothetical protein
VDLVRVLVKYERWKERLDDKAFHWRDNLQDKALRSYVEALGHLGSGDLDKGAKSVAAHAALAAEMARPENRERERLYSLNAIELKGRLALARGETLNGIGFLVEAGFRQATLGRKES